MKKFAALTPREEDVIELVSQGLMTEEIAARLKLANPTVKANLGRIYKKWQLRNRSEAVLAYQLREMMKSGE